MTQITAREVRYKPIMKTSELRRELKRLGAKFREGRKHTKVYLNGRQSTLPRHKTQEIGDGLRKMIYEQLGLGKPPP